MKILKTIAVQLFTGANVATIALLWICCLVTFISPENFPRLSLLTLLFPFILLANIAFVLFWLIFKIKRIWIPLLGIGVCYTFVRDYFPINLPTSPSDSALHIVTYNCHGFGRKESNIDEEHNLVMDYLADAHADIICLQEAVGETPRHKAFREKMAKRGYDHFQIKGNEVFSMLPILEGDTVHIPTHSNAVTRLYLQEGADTILLLNVHLESNKLTPEVKNAYIDAIKKHERDSMSKELEPVVNLLTLAAPFRAAQADTLYTLIRQWLPRPVIVCGDFNDTPVSYPLRLLTRHLVNAYRESGNGMGVTFKERGFPVRIDHVLFSGDRWTSAATHVDHAFSASDHYPLHTYLTRREPKTEKNQ